MPAEHQFIPPEPAELSARLPGYDVDRLIAKGGMGAVYHATQTSLDREVAIKVLPPELGDAHFREQFVAEAKSMAKLNHPNLIGIYDFGETDGMPYIVMEFVKGKSLYQHAYDEEISETEAARFISEICQGLAHAHEAGILHRDIKPANILLTPELKPKIGDFGLARPAGQRDANEVVYGTPGYAAPELLHSPEKAGPRADIFALGATLYELLTGKLPSVPFQPPSAFGANPKFDAIVRRAIHPSAGLRYSTANQLTHELERILASLDDRYASPRVEKSPTPLTGPVTHKVGGATVSTRRPTVPPGRRPAPTTVKLGSNLPLVRNLAIIAILGTILWFVWGAYQQRSADNIAEQAEIDRKYAEELAKKKAGNQPPEKPPGPEMTGGPKIAPPEPPDPDPVIPPPPPKVETPMEVLARLKPQLASGDRSEFPPGAVTAGDSTLFFVTETLPWSGAARFAEEHGGHLVCIPDPASLIKVGDLMPDSAELAWIGGGAAGGPDWAWINGEPWKHRNPSTSLGTCAALDPTGVLKARRDEVTLPFFIEWKNDGSNPGSLESQFKRLAQTLEGPSPAWLPGTITSEARRYYLVRVPTSWDEADLNASSASATLAVASERSENFVIKSFLDGSLVAGEACWLGGRKTGENWGWVTNEAWAFATWKDGFPVEKPEATSLGYQAGDAGGWINAAPGEKLAGYLLEWSPDSERAPAGPAPAAGNEIEGLRTLGKKLHGQADAVYTEAMAKAAKDVRWESNQWIRGLAQGDQATYGPNLTALMDLIGPDGVIPQDYPRDGVPAKIAGIMDHYIKKQALAKLQRDKEFERLRRAYVQKLQETLANLKEAGLTDRAKIIETEITAVGQTAATFDQRFSR